MFYVLVNYRTKLEVFNDISDNPEETITWKIFPEKDKNKFL